MTYLPYPRPGQVPHSEGVITFRGTTVRTLLVVTHITISAIHCWYRTLRYQQLCRYHTPLVPHAVGVTRLGIAQRQAESRWMGRNPTPYTLKPYMSPEQRRQVSLAGTPAAVLGFRF